MKETGIIMSGSHPVDILEGRKTMTRRTWGLEKINKDPDAWMLAAVFQDGCARFARTDGSEDIALRCPYGGYGDKLWVRETFALTKDAGDKPPPISQLFLPLWYKASGDKIASYNRWRPSIHMPRWASRILLEITELRAERLQEITERDAEAEGLNPTEYNNPNAYADFPCTNQFIALWDSLNAKRGYDWEVNPWVWVISFRIVNT